MSAATEIQPRTREELESLMESAFRQGEVGETALLCWESMARFPESSSVARIYCKKLLRDPEVAGIDLAAFKHNAKVLREEDQPEELARLAAMGLLRFPAQRYLSLSLMDAAEKLSRREWLRPAVSALGEPADDDVVLLNAVASLEQEAGNYERAHTLFKKLHRLEPENEVIVQNYSASLTGLKRFGQAIRLLESFLANSEEPKKYLLRLTPLYRLAGEDVETKLEELDAEFFANCETVAKARVHADLRLFRQDLYGMAHGLRKLLEHKWDPGASFELAEIEIAQGQIDAGLERYGVRFEAFPHLTWFSSDKPLYEGQELEDEVLFIWGEQGIGDEVMFSMFFQILSEKVNNVVIGMDPRLGQAVAQQYPHWKFYDRHQMPDDIPAIDYVCPMGRLMEMWLPSLIENKHQFHQPIIEPDPSRLAKIKDLLAHKSKPRVAITWRGGANVNGQIRSMELAQLVAGLPDDASIDVISLQYDGDHEQEVIDLGDRRVALSGLNNRWDLEGVFALLRCCDAVLTVDNAVAHFATALGIPTAVLIPAAQVQFRWKNPDLKRLLFPSAELFIQPKPGDWEIPVEQAWRYVMDVVSRDISEG